MSSSVVGKNNDISKEYILGYFENLLKSFEETNVIFGKESPKSLILGALWVVKNSLSLCENVSGDFRCHSNASLEFHLNETEVGNNEKLSVLFDSVEDETNGMPNSNRRVVYKGSYSITFKTSKGDLKINWCMDNFVAHLNYFACFDKNTNQRHFFLPKDFNSDYLEAFSSTGSDSCNFKGNVASAELLVIFDGLLHLLEHASRFKNMDSSKSTEVVHSLISYFMEAASNMVNYLNEEEVKGRSRELVFPKDSRVGPAQVKYN